MVAVTLSMILMAGVIQVYVSAKASYTVQHELSTLQQNQRIAIELLSNDIRKAGLSIDQAVSAFYTKDTKIANWDGENDDSDQITIAYESEKNCLGFETPKAGEDNAGIAVNRYFISNDNHLSCEGNGTVRSLVPGITNMQILYGEDTDPIVPGQIRTANRYVKPADANMNNVVSVRIALLFETDGVVRGVDEAEAQTRSYKLLDGPTLVFDDQDPTQTRQIRREVVTTTITLRNSS